MDKKYIQLPRFQTHRSKSEAISLVERHINESLTENPKGFVDGEEIAVEYRTDEGGQAYVSAIVKITGNIATLYVPINEHETLKITDTENEPIDKTSLWVTEMDESDIHYDVNKTLASLLEEYRKLKETVERHEYALSNTLAGGDIILNAQKYDIENESEHEKPEDAEYDENYAEEDFEITSYDIFVADSSLRRFSNDKTILYAEQKYKLTLKLYNRSGELVKETEDVSLTFRHSADVEINERRYLISHTTGYTNIVSEVRVNGVLIDNEPYYVNFGGDQEPDYPIYEEPNVHHQLIKTAKTHDILMDNIKYLATPEFCWCPGDNKLYLKAESSNGTIQLFVINGGGGSIDPIDPDTGSTTGDTAITEETTFKVVDGELLMDSTGDGVYVDANGILNINAGRVENGILILNDSQTTGSTPDTGTTPDYSTAVVDGNGILNIGGNTAESGGVIMLNAVVTPDGILEITT